MVLGRAQRQRAHEMSPEVLEVEHYVKKTLMVTNQDLHRLTNTHSLSLSLSPHPHPLTQTQSSSSL